MTHPPSAVTLEVQMALAVLETVLAIQDRRLDTKQGVVAIATLLESSRTTAFRAGQEWQRGKDAHKASRWSCLGLSDCDARTDHRHADICPQSIAQSILSAPLVSPDREPT